jgi:hypothetical protein
MKYSIDAETHSKESNDMFASFLQNKDISVSRKRYLLGRDEETNEIWSYCLKADDLTSENIKEIVDFLGSQPESFDLSLNIYGC